MLRGMAKRREPGTRTGTGKNTARRVAMACALVALAVGAAAAFVFRHDLLVPLYLWQLDSKNGCDRLRAAEKLGKVRSARAVPRLVELLGVCSAHAPKAQVYGGALVKIGPPAVPTLLDALASRDFPAGSSVPSVLFAIAPRAIPELASCLKGGKPAVRRWAATILGTMDRHAPEVVPLLRAALSDREEAVRAEAAFYLARLENPPNRKFAEAAPGEAP